MKKNCFTIFSGGTGGHVIPAVIFGNYLIENGYQCTLFLDKRGLDYAKNFKGKIIKINSALKANKKIDKRKLNRDKKNLISDSEKKASIWHTTSNVMDDSVIDPRNTREYLRLCVEVIYKEDIKGSNSFGTFRM